MDTIPEGSATDVTFNVSVTNNGSISVNLAKLTDDIYGDIADPANTLIESTTCDLAPAVVIPPTGTIANPNPYLCSFTVSLTLAVVGDEQKDTVCASGTDTQGSPVGGDEQTDPASSFCDDATVTASNVATSACLSKTVTSADVKYTVVVSNPSVADDLPLTKLCDDKFGDLTQTDDTICGVGPFGTIVSSTCGTGNVGEGAVLPATVTKNGGTYTCSFVGTITGTNTDIVTGTLDDPDSDTTDLTPSDTATVTITSDSTPGCVPLPAPE